MSIPNNNNYTSHYTNANNYQSSENINSIKNNNDINIMNPSNNAHKITSNFGNHNNNKNNNNNINKQNQRFINTQQNFQIDKKFGRTKSPPNIQRKTLSFFPEKNGNYIPQNQLVNQMNNYPNINIQKPNNVNINGYRYNEKNNNSMQRKINNPSFIPFESGVGFINSPSQPLPPVEILIQGTPCYNVFVGTSSNNYTEYKGQSILKPPTTSKVYNIKEIKPSHPHIIKEPEAEEKMKEKIIETNEKMLKRQKTIRHQIDQFDPIFNGPISPQKEEQIINEKKNVVLEDMCIYGNIMKSKIEKEKKKIKEKQKESQKQNQKDKENINENSPEKYIETEKALKMEKENEGIFALGLISSILENNNIQTLISIDNDEKENKNDEDEENLAETSLQFVTNGLIDKKKYELIFDLDNNRVNEILFNEKEFEKFSDNLKTKISNDYNISKDKIIVTFPQKGSLSVQIIFQSDEFNDLDLEEFKNKFKNEKKFRELSKLKDIHTGIVTEGVILDKKQLDPRGNRKEWPEGENRGGEIYHAPKGWIGIGLKVLGVYFDDGWLGMDNIPGEWVVAYHGLGCNQPSDFVTPLPGRVFNMGLKAGGRQVHENCPDYFHPGRKVGKGVYITPLIKVAEKYAGISIIGGKKYKTVIMVRVKPKARRHCHECEESKKYKYWVVNGISDEIRPYRILYKKVK